MPVLNAGKYRHWVELADLDADGTPVALEPARVKCAIRPGAPSAFDDSRISHQVETRFHPGIGLRTRIQWTDKRDVVHDLFVKGIQNVDYLDRELVLLCEEVIAS